MQDFMPEKVLIVQTAFIGDVILATALVESVKQKWPLASIDFVVIPAAANLLEKNPHLRRVVIFDKRGVHRRSYGIWRFARQLRAENYDLALVPHRSFRSASLVWMARVPLRVGFDRSAAPWAFHHTLVYRQTHEVERNLDLLLPFGGAKELPPKIYWSAEDATRIDEVLRPQPTDGVPVVALAPGSVWYTKRWPQEYFQELAKRAIDKLGCLVVLVGGQEDVVLCKQIRDAVGSNCLSVAGQLTLRQTAALLQRCEMLVSNDSAPTHLGVAAQCRVITIFGSTKPAFGFAPYDPEGDRHAIFEQSLSCRPCTDHGRRRCPLGTLDCLRLITPERVLAKIAETFKEAVSEHDQNLAY